jgi:hypothetical protein
LAAGCSMPAKRALVRKFVTILGSHMWRGPIWRAVCPPDTVFCMKLAAAVPPPQLWWQILEDAI